MDGRGQNQSGKGSISPTHPNWARSRAFQERNRAHGQGAEPMVGCTGRGNYPSFTLVQQGHIKEQPAPRIWQTKELQASVPSIFLNQLFPINRWAAVFWTNCSFHALFKGSLTDLCERERRKPFQDYLIYEVPKATRLLISKDADAMVTEKQPLVAVVITHMSSLILPLSL